MVLNKKILLLYTLIIITACNKNNSKEQASVDLTFLKTHTFNIDNGEKVFNQSCITCHLYGTGGATMLRDTDSWEFLLNQKTIEEIYLNVLNGYIGDKGPMPKKGGCIRCSEEDLLDAIEYILYLNSLTVRNQKLNMNE